MTDERDPRRTSTRYDAERAAPAVPAAGLEPARSRVSWGAVVAGAVMTLIVLLVLQLVLLWLGFTAIDPAQEARPFEGIGTGAAIGFALSSAIALFVGGLVAGRAANRVASSDVILHGLLTWAVVTLAATWFATTAVGALLSGAVGIVGQGIGTIAAGASAVAPAAAEQIERLVDDQDVALREIQEEMAPLWTDPAARSEFRAVVTRIVRDGDPTVSQADRDELVEIVATNTELSEAEAEARVDDWVATYEDARERLAAAEEDLRIAGQEAADALARAAMWAVIGLVLGAVIAMLGARSGAPKDRLDTRAA